MLSSTLARFTRDLTAEARAGRLDPIRCRADEIARVIDILLRHGKNNPALVGPAGVGKTAIVEGLAQRIAHGVVPLSLRDVRLLAVDHVSLLAGTTYRGQYEERIQGLVDETSAAHDVVLFIDELHNLIGQGTAMGVAMDAANMLKPALVRGEFRVIGATTDDEYERWVCGDPALERRFQKVSVRELSGDETLEILRARGPVLERHHTVVIAESALLASLRLTDALITDRMRPDRALDALDEACAHTQAVAQFPPAILPLVAERRALLRTVVRGAAGRSAGERPRGEHDAFGEPDPIDRMARDGMAALERFGAELEAMFAMPVGVPAAEAPDTSPRAAASPHLGGTPEVGPAVAGAAVRLAALDLEIAAALTEAGIVVRGHDVARVVGLSTGRRVEWSDT